MIRNSLGRLFPYFLAVAWLVAVGHTVISVGGLGAANARLAQGTGERPPAALCACLES